MLAPNHRMQRNPGSQRRARSVRRGTATVELAIVIPFLVLVAMGMVEITRAAQVKETLTDVVRGGARIAALPNATNDMVTANINQTLASAGISTSNVTITIQVNGATANASTAVRGDRVSVNVALPINSIGWITPMFFNNQSIQSETLVMMRQG